MVPDLGDVITTAVTTALDPAIAALEAIMNAIELVVDSIFSVTFEADIAAMIAVNSNGKTEGSFDFDLKVCYKDKCLTAGIHVSATIDALDASLVSDTAEGIFKNIISLASKSLNQAEEEFNKGFKEAKAELTGAAGDLFGDLSDIGNAILGGLKNTYAAAGGVFGGRSSSCGKDANFGFQKCRDCAEMSRNGNWWSGGRLMDKYLANYKTGNWEFRGMRRQHQIESHACAMWDSRSRTCAKSGSPSKEQCFGVCFDLSRQIYDAWTEATTYETVLVQSADNRDWWNGYTGNVCGSSSDPRSRLSNSLDPKDQTKCHVREELAIGEDEEDCENDCTMDVNCVGYVFDNLARTGAATGAGYCLRARWLPSWGPWACYYSNSDDSRGPDWGTTNTYMCDEGFWDDSPDNIAYAVFSACVLARFFLFFRFLSQGQEPPF